MLRLANKKKTRTDGDTLFQRKDVHQYFEKEIYCFASLDVNKNKMKRIVLLIILAGIFRTSKAINYIF